MKITSVETIQLTDLPYLVFVRIGTDEGITGTSDTYYTADAVRGFVHQDAAPILLGADPFRTEAIWDQLHTHHMARWGGIGMEMRALSAIDVALWDIRAQALGVPVYQLLGGLVHDTIQTYNTCAGPMYGLAGFNRAGEGKSDLDDLWAQNNEPARLAEELLAQGIQAMKIWPFDRFAPASGGKRVTAAEIREGLRPFREIRAAVGDDIDIMLEGHGYWNLTSAQQIAAAVEEFSPAWLEDMIIPNDIDALLELKNSTTTPIVASEMLTTRNQFRPLLERRAADIVMIDPTWAGGITESKKIIALAETYGRPVTMHDCTGPFTMLAGIHLAVSAPNAIFQESLRAYLATWYPGLTTIDLRIEKGRIHPPTEPGIGAALRADVLDRHDVVHQISQ
ncbi:MAG: mandelate racemase/muconate lactonizing enzyme family protein [Microbacteriaceae bacterium]|nr:mandelate racemase/muconate lactonizing enzyme family protein [Microbacteriaceae bacterium]